jgi:cytochrome c peroxidase
VEALDSFQKSLITFTAPYDRYVLGDQQALSPAQVRGLILFRSFATRCAECHTPPLFTNQEVLTIGAPGEHRAFRVPTLRQIAKTGPYMHRGAFASLGEVVHFYNQGGGRSSQGVSGRSTHWHVRPIGMGPDDERDLVAFLGALTDDGWMVDIPQRVPSGLKPTAR